MLKEEINKNVVKLMRHAIKSGKARNMTDWCAKIGIGLNNMAQIRSGAQVFTHQQIYNAVLLSGTSVDFVYGLQRNIDRNNKRIKPVISVKTRK